MTGHLLLRGMIAGLVAGLVAFGFARVYGEPQVDRAIAFEELMAAAEAPADGAAEEPEAVSRETQAGLGLFTGVVTYSVAMGGIFSLVFAGLYGRVGRLSPRALALVLGAATFVALVAVPDLKYPPNPPAVGDPETIGLQLTLWTVLSLVFGYLAERSLRRSGNYRAVPAGI